MYTAWQRAYLAHWLSLAKGDEQALTQTMASARVDMNPHQVDAALFALRSPLSRGALLADEVGLGKTIEASLVLAQKWAEQRRRLLLIVPATLRKQWSQELIDKFELPSVILDSKKFNAARKRGVDNPFDEQSTIVICSYEFAARKQRELGLIQWDLVVFDEAHKLRNSYKAEGAKIAKALEAALAGSSKLLLSATPLQNNLLELYGLVSIIDPHFFGDLESFKARYCRPKMPAAELMQLRSRLQSVCRRTLRRQVQEEGGINFTRRYSLTEAYDPYPDEKELYARISSYLQDESTLAIQPKARQLVTLVIRKILASSSHAIQGTLQRMIDRLEKRQSLAEALQDYEELDDLSDATAVDDEDFVDPVALQAEIDRLKDFLQLASGIARNAKGEALQRALERAFDSAERLGGPRKAVIFTESVRTQAWLFEQLSSAGYAGQIVLLNGSNDDADSQQTYRAWLEKHKGSSRISNAKSADMKAALVERFREQASIMICTEAGAEGINLQFCSLLINYDLPWNPQRVEQRIGRVHRYGQLHDVVVVNFINNGNVADRRVFELLNRKFQLFEGVFGASDEILGAIESGVDIEQRIHRIYQQCRTTAEIEAEFDRLQAELEEQIDSRNREAQRALLENFDVDVVQRLSMRRERARRELDDYQQRLLLLARMSLPQAHFEAERFQLDGQWYDPHWQSAEQTDARFFQPATGLGAQLIAEAQAALTGAGQAELAFVYEPTGNGQLSDLQRFIGQSGELQVEKLRLTSGEERREYLLLAGRSDSGEELDERTCSRLLQLKARELSPAATLRHGAALQLQLDALRRAHLAEAEARNARFFEEETGKFERWAEDKRIGQDLRIRQLDQEIKEARKAVRQLETLQEKMAAKKALQKLERERDRLMLDYHEEKKKIETEEDRLLEEIERKLQIGERQEALFALRWRLEGER